MLLSAQLPVAGNERGLFEGLSRSSWQSAWLHPTMLASPLSPPKPHKQSPAQHLGTMEK